MVFRVNTLLSKASTIVEGEGLDHVFLRVYQRLLKNSM